MEHSDIVNKWSIFRTFTIYWSLWETIAGWEPADLYVAPMPACTTLPPNANFGLSDRSYCSRVLYNSVGPTSYIVSMAIV